MCVCVFLNCTSKNFDYIEYILYKNMKQLKNRDSRARGAKSKRGILTTVT